MWKIHNMSIKTHVPVWWNSHCGFSQYKSWYQTCFNWITQQFFETGKDTVVRALLCREMRLINKIWTRRIVWKKKKESSNMNILDRVYWLWELRSLWALCLFPALLFHPFQVVPVLELDAIVIHKWLGNALTVHLPKHMRLFEFCCCPDCTLHCSWILPILQDNLSCQARSDTLVSFEEILCVV